jgi:hypothetical protein
VQMATKRAALVCTPFKDKKDGLSELLDEAGSEEDAANEDEAGDNFCFFFVWDFFFHAFGIE